GRRVVRPGNAIMFGKWFVKDGEIGIKDVAQRAVSLEEFSEKTDGLFIHRAAQCVESWEMAFTFFIAVVEIAHVQPLAGEFDRKTTDTWVVKHPTRLGGERLSFT